MPQDHRRSLQVMRWGLGPFGVKDLKAGFANINAKTEGVWGFLPIPPQVMLGMSTVVPAPRERARTAQYSRCSPLH